MAKKDYYKILGIPRNEDREGIRAAYRRRAKGCHPDICGDETRRDFQDLREAYETLSDPIKREHYDEELRNREHGTTGRRTRGPSPPGGRRPAHFAGRPFDSVLDALFGDLEGFTERERGAEGAVEVEIELSAEEARRGGRLPLELPYGGVCPHCRGAGRTWRYVCRHCAGSGRERRRLSCGVRIPAGVRDGEVLEVDLGRFGGVALARVRVT